MGQTKWDKKPGTNIVNATTGNGIFSRWWLCPACDKDDIKQTRMTWNSDGS